MTPSEAVNAAYSGDLVKCSADEWPAVRRALQDAAGKMIDSGQGMRANLMLQEVRRLDGVFGAAALGGTT
jgi:hypothetical protein